MSFALRTAGLLIVVAAALAGCTPAPAPIAPTPTNGANLPPIVEEEWDAKIVHEFPTDDGDVTCTAYVRAEGGNAEAEAASAFLAEGNWDDVEVSLDQYEEEDLEQRRAQGVTDPELLMMLVTNKVSEDLTTAGLFSTNISVQNDTRCE